MHGINIAILLGCAAGAAWGLSVASIWLLPVGAVVVIAQAAGATTVIAAARQIGEGEKSSLYRTLAAAVNAALRNDRS